VSVICSNCGATNATGRKFCLECGTRLAASCPSCGAQNEAGAKFCGECGTTIGDATDAATRPGAGAQGASSPGGPTSGTGAAAAGGGAAPTAERRLVSVLFADLVGFTTLSESQDSETVRELLSRYFDVAREIVDRYGGVVEKFIGDAVMAVWGTPIAHEDDAERAVRAGLELVDAVRSLAPGVQARAGVLTGEAAVTLGATGQGMVAGDLVNTASRLQGAASPGTVLVGEATRRAASGAIAFEEAGEHLLKGKAVPVAAFRALRVVAKRGGAGRSEGLEAPFVGRDDELRLLKDFFHSTARDRRTRLVSVTGVAGVGKSRLAWEFLKYIDGLVEDIYWHQGRSPAFGEGITFWALGEMVRRRAGLAEGDDVPMSRTRIAEMLDEYVSDETERRWLEPRLLALLGIEEVPAGGRDELFAAWRTFFERVAERGTVVLVFEDLHWADSGLLDFIDHVLEWSRTQPIYIVTLARPELLERRPEWGAGRRNFVALSLEPLTEPAMRQLLAGIVPGLPQPTVRAIVARADGIPLYAVETIRMLVAEGRLTEADGVYRPTGDLSQLAVPESLHALIAARLDALDPSDRALLQDGAVLGQTFSVAALAAITGESVDSLEPRLRALVRRELLVLDTDPRSPERGQYGFTQALVRDVAYGTLAKRDRRARHVAAARYFESLGDEELAGVLATHYLDAYHAAPEGPEAEALGAQARVSLRAAAERATALGSHEQAVAYFERAMSVTTEPAEEAELLGRAGSAAGAAGRYDDAERYLRRTIQIHREIGDRSACAAATAQLGRVLLDGRRTEVALAALEPAAREFADLSDDPGAISVGAQLARAYFFNDDNARSVEQADVVLTAAERLDLIPILADTLVTKGSAMANVGRLREGSALLVGAADLAQANGLTATQVRALVNLGVNLGTTDPAAGVETSRTALEISTRLGLRAIAVNSAANIAEYALFTGDWAPALAEVESALELDLDPADRLTLLCVAVGLRAAVGTPVQEDLTEIDRVAADATDQFLQSGIWIARAWVSLFAGRLEDVRAAGMEVARSSSINAPFGLAIAGHAALWMGDARLARASLELLDATGIHGALVDSDRAALTAGIQLIDGLRDEGLAGFRAVRRRLRDLSLPLALAVCDLDVVSILGADDPDARDAADEARETLSRLGCEPLLARLDEMTERRRSASTAAGGSAHRRGAALDSDPTTEGAASA
jgi:class 3 adenylate cyclase/tetratricopeptide (TPR) repeat protein